jgi:integrase/recombinase XerD
MFETLFTRPGVLRRHRKAPLATERASYLNELAAQRMARGTVLRRSSYCLCVAEEIQRWPAFHCFDEAEVETLAAQWAEKRVRLGRASSPRWPKEHFRFTAMDFLRSIGRLRLTSAAVAGQYDPELTEFITTQQECRWLSEQTARSARWQVRRFLDHIEQRGVALGNVVSADVDAFYEYMAPFWSRNSLHTSAKILRAWFGFCEKRGWVRTGLANGILLPRIYRHEGLPIGPTWATVSRMLAETNGGCTVSLRDHAILLLLSVYGLRSGELRRLRLEDIDWEHDKIRFVRSKISRSETAPLEPRVGNAIARYLREGRPTTDSRVVFLTVRAPYRALSAGGLYHVVEHRLRTEAHASKGRGPHGLRHACARHLVEAGRSFKEVGDHLGHRSPDATRIYAKVNLRSLRRVAFDELGGLS